ncbi:hypothetical protein S83_060208, partial [Arachis hypogaea]
IGLGLTIVITGLDAALIDKTGRKPLLLVDSKQRTTHLQTLLISETRLVAGCIFTAAAFYLKLKLPNLEDSPPSALPMAQPLVKKDDDHDDE